MSNLPLPFPSSDRSVLLSNYGLRVQLATVERNASTARRRADPTARVAAHLVARALLVSALRTQPRSLGNSRHRDDARRSRCRKHRLFLFAKLLRAHHAWLHADAAAGVAALEALAADGGAAKHALVGNFEEGNAFGDLAGGYAAVAGGATDGCARGDAERVIVDGISGDERCGECEGSRGKEEDVVEGDHFDN